MNLHSIFCGPAAVVAAAVVAVAVAAGAAAPAHAELTCDPMHLQKGESGHNPAAFTKISFDNGVWSVVHHMQDGSSSSRQDQYEMHNERPSGYDPINNYKLEWGGARISNPDYYMTALVWPESNHWWYSEQVTYKGKLVSYTVQDCGPAGTPLAPVRPYAPQAPAPVVTQPAPEPQPTTTASAPAPEPQPQVTQPSGGDHVPIYLNDGGRSVWVDVQLGSLTQRMLIDTGATSISIPKSIANDLLRRGEASLEDPGQVTIANGSTYAESLIRIDTVRVGNRVLHDMIAGVSPEQAAPLLGFPVLNQAGRFTIDTKNRQLIFD
jgi:clan AA aspartic protease (TIGR02281 family)